MILHIDMDAFFASVEQAINPKLKGRPLIVGSRNNRLHTVVCAASYEAKAYGIDSGMPSAEAFKLCPDLEFVAAEQAKYIWTSEEILKMLKECGLEVNYASIDEFQLDAGDDNDPLNLAREIQVEIQKAFNISASVGIARNFLLAKLASKINKPNGIAMLTEENLANVLAGLGVEKLCGIGRSLSQNLYSLGVLTCLDLYHKSAGFLEQNLGKNGLNLYLSLHSSESFNSSERETMPKSVGHSYTLSRASKNPLFIRAWLRLLSDMVAFRLRQKNLVSKTVSLWLNTPETANLGSQKTHQHPTNDGFEIFSRCLKIMAKSGQQAPKIRALGVSCSNLSLSSYPLLLKEEKRREGLIKAIDKINSRHGESSIYPAIVTLASQKITQ